MEQLLQLLQLSQFQLGNLSIIEIRQIISNLANKDVDFSIIDIEPNKNPPKTIVIVGIKIPISIIPTFLVSYISFNTGSTANMKAIDVKTINLTPTEIEEGFLESTIKDFLLNELGTILKLA
jgi:hypothetical protein